MHNPTDDKFELDLVEFGIHHDCQPLSAVEIEPLTLIIEQDHKPEL